MSSPASFIRHLRALGRRDLGKVATLRRSLGGEPGEDVRAFPLVEPYLPGESDARSRAAWEWDRRMYYLVAGLWASVNTASVIAAAAADEEDEEPSGDAPIAEPPAQSLTERGRLDRRSFGRAVVQLYRQRDRTESIERRFVALLDADEAQLPHHLRQMVQLLRTEDGIPIHWAELLADLRQWNRDDRRVQQRWARAFYREALATDADDESAATNDATGDAATMATPEGA